MFAVPAKRFAMVGCGAIAESYFLPALIARPNLCSALFLVDSNPERLAETSRRFAISRTSTRLESIIGDVDVAVIATPHDTHYPISQTLIAAGKHILCEKPMTTTPDEGVDMVSAADRAGVVLMTNNWRRACPAFREIKRIIDTGALGAPLGASWTEGKKFNWPTTSGFYFTQQSRNGLPPPGIMLDIGAHVIDLLCWWFGSNPTVVDCQTDSFGGPEARATMELRFGNVNVQTDLTYYQKLTNTYELRFERGTIRGHADDPHRFVLHERGKRRKVVSLKRNDPAVFMISNFISVIAGQDQPVVTGRDVLPSIKAIFEAYQIARTYDAPWLPRLGT